MTNDQNIHFKVKLDCKLGDKVALFMHRGALLAATMLYNAYEASKEYLIGTGPELYAEQWIFNFIVFSNEEFDDLVMTYFIKILIGAQNGE